MESVKAELMGLAFALGVLYAKGKTITFDEAKWITVKPNGAENKGRPMLIESETGQVLGGIGGGFNGRHISAVKAKGKFEQPGAQMQITARDPAQKAAAMNNQRIDFKQVTSAPQQASATPQPTTNLADNVKNLQKEVKNEQKRIKEETKKFSDVQNVGFKKSDDEKIKRALANDKTLTNNDYSDALNMLEYRKENTHKVLSDQKIDEYIEACKNNFAEKVRLAESHKKPELRDKFDSLLDKDADIDTLKSNLESTLQSVIDEGKNTGDINLIKSSVDFYKTAKEIKDPLEFRGAVREYLSNNNFGNSSQYLAKMKQSTANIKHEKLPTKISTASLGKPMNFEEANHQKANPNFKTDEKARINCQTCVLAYKARKDGYNVEALPNTTEIQDRLSKATNMAYINTKTGTYPEIKKFKRPTEMLNTLEATAKDGELYNVEWAWKKGKDGHIINAFKENGSLVLYDPQVGEKYTKRDFFNKYIRTGKISPAKKKTLFLMRGQERKYGSASLYYHHPAFYRTDDCDYNLDIANAVLKGAKL